MGGKFNPTHKEQQAGRFAQDETLKEQKRDSRMQQRYIIFPDKLILKISYCEITIQGNKNPMSAVLAHQKADKHFCVALHRKVRIRLHPSTETLCSMSSKRK
jgi:hypothetical protein